MSEQEPVGRPTPEEAVRAVEGTEPVAEPAPEPTFASSPADWPPSAPGTADDRPEIGVGAAFAGGIAAAWLLKRLARRKHRRV